MDNLSQVLTHRPARPDVAAKYFADRLAFEADPDDVIRDIRAGTTDGYVLVETRSPEAFAAARIPGAINLPYRDVDATTTADLDRDLVYVCYCMSFQCNAGAKGALRLAELGFKVKLLSGGLAAWRADGYPVEGDQHTPSVCAC